MSVRVLKQAWHAWGEWPCDLNFYMTKKTCATFAHDLKILKWQKDAMWLRVRDLLAHESICSLQNTVLPCLTLRFVWRKLMRVWWIEIGVEGMQCVWNILQHQPLWMLVSVTKSSCWCCWCCWWSVDAVARPCCCWPGKALHLPCLKRSLTVQALRVARSRNFKNE